MEKVTIIIPNYNGMKFLGGCLEALRQQQDGTPEFGICVVDNGSEDGSVPFLKENYPEVNILSLSENTGFCYAVNRGIQASKTPYVILLNNDTKAGTQFVARLVDAIEKREDAFAISAKMLMWDKPDLIDDAGDDYCVFGWAYGRGKGKEKTLYDKACRVFSACGGAAIYRREVFETIGLFDELHFAYLEDLDICYRANLYGYRNYYEPGAEVVHFGSASTGSRYNERKTVLAASNNVYVLAKNMPFLQLLWNFPFLFLGFFIKYLFFVKKKMGKLYGKGLIQGLKKSFSKEGREKKIRFRWKNLKQYLWIQGQLYKNTVLFIKKN